MIKHFVKDSLLSNNYWVLSKSIVKLFGLEAAFLLSNFAEAEKMMADQDGWFYQTSDTVEEMTTLSRHKQDQAIKQLEDLGVLEKDIRGMPAKRYFKFNDECLTNLIVNFQQSSMPNFNKLDCKKSATSKELNHKELNYKESIKPCPTSLKFDEATIEYQLAQRLYKKILLNDSKAKKPNLNKWAEHIDKLIRLDGRDVDTVETVIDFATSDNFWRANILSANKLREKFQQLYLKMNQGGSKSLGGGKSGDKKWGDPDYYAIPDDYDGF